MTEGFFLGHPFSFHIKVFENKPFGLLKYKDNYLL